MAVVTIDIDGEIPLSEQPETGHNRWHWDIAPVTRCASGDEVVVGTRDALDGQLDLSSTSADIEKVDVGRIHPLTGPVWIDGAEPGDLLEVEVLEVNAPGYGFTSQRPGLGLLAEEMAEPFLVHWKLENNRAQSDQLPGVSIKGNPFLGIVGVAPSAALIAKSIERESCTLRSALEPRSAIPATERIASEGLRTGPPRENGGNVDVKQLTAGARILLPVWHRGGLLSVGDAHFAQGDGEVCGTAIEMGSVSRLRLTRHKAGLDLSSLPMPFIEHSFGDVQLGPAFTVLGHPVAGHPDRLRSAAASAIRSLCTRISERYDYPFAAAYALCSVAADLRVAQVVNEPYVSVSATIMLNVFSDGGLRLRERVGY